MSFKVIEEWGELDHPKDSSNRTITYRIVDVVGFDGQSTIMTMELGGPLVHVGGIRPSDHKPTWTNRGKPRPRMRRR